EDPDSVALGNPQGDVTVVEFFDYRCTYCKVVRPALVELLKADGKVKLVYKEFPILGRDSVLASKAALAARNQKKYEEFHDGLMRLRGPINEQAVMTLASELGLNLEKMKKDMEAPEIATALKRNVELARALNVNGTPAWVLGDRVVSGALDPNTMKSMIEQSRKTAPNKS
ncbi:MAG: DsbA family protein, partial [Rhodospirillales bacterium]|nr:DsbA family protein [Rhodospirillales bacterium]